MFVSIAQLIESLSKKTIESLPTRAVDIPFRIHTTTYKEGEALMTKEASTMMHFNNVIHLNLSVGVSTPFLLRASLQTIFLFLSVVPSRV